MRTCCCCACHWSVQRPPASTIVRPIPALGLYVNYVVKYAHHLLYSNDDHASGPSASDGGERARVVGRRRRSPGNGSGGARASRYTYNYFGLFRITA